MASIVPVVEPAQIVWLRPGVTGLHVFQLEEALRRCGLLSVPSRGVFDGIVEAALKNHQGAAQAEPTGEVDSDTWQRLWGSGGPSLFSRAISCVSEIQGGLRWDSASSGPGGLSWGVCGMDAWSGLLGAAVREVPADLLGTALGMQRAMQLQQICSWDRWRRCFSSRIAATHGIGGALSSGWQTGLQRLGKLEVAPRIQLQVLHDRAWSGVVTGAPEGTSETRVLEAFWGRITRHRWPVVPPAVLEAHGISPGRAAVDASVDGPERLLELYGGRASR